MKVYGKALPTGASATAQCGCKVRKLSQRPKRCGWNDISGYTRESPTARPWFAIQSMCRLEAVEYTLTGCTFTINERNAGAGFIDGLVDVDPLAMALEETFGQ